MRVSHGTCVPDLGACVLQNHLRKAWHGPGIVPNTGIVVPDGNDARRTSTISERAPLHRDTGRARITRAVDVRHCAQPDLRQAHFEP